MAYHRANARCREETPDSGERPLPRGGLRGRDGGSVGDDRDHAPARPARDGERRSARADPWRRHPAVGSRFTADRRLRTPVPVAAAPDRALAGAAQHVVVLADYTKMGGEPRCQTVPAARVHTLITDSKAPASELEAIRSAGLEVRVADVGGNGESKRPIA